MSQSFAVGRAAPQPAAAQAAAGELDPPRKLQLDTPVLWLLDLLGQRDCVVPFPPARPAGRGRARGACRAVWGSRAVFALLPGSRAPRALSGMIADMASGEPNWRAWLDTRLAAALTYQGLL